MARSRPTPDGGIRRRPKDRKAQIARASAEAFSALGYHAVSMEAIASRVGISATALYRHYPSKYDLFRDAVLALGEQLVECTAFADEAPADAETLRRLISALIDTALANRESGGLYRWEARYLRGDDQTTLNGQMRTVNRRIHRPLMALRPELTVATALDAVVVHAERDRQHRRSPRQVARHPHSCGAGRNRHRHLDCRRAGPARRVRRRGAGRGGRRGSTRRNTKRC